MQRPVLAATLALSLLGSGGFGASALAQAPAPVGGPAAKGNAPLKNAHTVNDGSAKPAANSFTEGQARQHILNSGYGDVSGLSKGKDGVWRGMATRDGAHVSVALDFKGNVTQSAMAAARPSTPAAASHAAAPPAAAPPATTTGAGDGTSGAGATDGSSMAATSAATASSTATHHHRHHHRHGGCAHPGANGVACSGVDTTGKGISDKEQRAMQAGAHP